MILALFILFGLTHSAFAGYVDPVHKWPKTALTVCFIENQNDFAANTDIAYFVLPDPTASNPKNSRFETMNEMKVLPLDESIKAAIRAAVPHSFSLDRTGIEFTGFKDCAETPHYDVAVFYSDHPEDEMAAADIGYQKKRSSIRINRGYLETIPDWDVFGKNYFSLSIVHEFGHIVGLRHEQERLTAHSKIDAIDLSKDAKRSSSFDYIAKMYSPLKKNPYESPNEWASRKKQYVNIGEVNAFSTMNSEIQDLMNFAHRLDEICNQLSAPRVVQTPKIIFAWTALANFFKRESTAPFESEELKKEICEDKTYLEFLPPTEESGHSYFNDGDEEALRFLYLHKAPQNLFLASEERKMSYLASWPKILGKKGWLKEK